MIKLTKDEVGLVLDSDLGLLERYATSHGISVEECRGFILDIAPVIDFTKYGPGGFLGNMRRVVEERGG